MTQFVMAYLPIENLNEAVLACIGADAVRMDNLVAYWEFVTPDIAKWQNAYITDELLNAITTETNYHIIKWDSWHNLFLVLFASAFMPEDVYGLAGRLSPQRDFFEHHIKGMLKRMSSQQALGARASDGDWEFIYRSEEGNVIFIDDNITYCMPYPCNTAITHAWYKNNNVFAWQLELTSVVMGIRGSLYVNPYSYSIIFAK